MNRGLFKADQVKNSGKNIFQGYRYDNLSLRQQFNKRKWKRGLPGKGKKLSPGSL
jgi:hypothetical protein